MTKFTGEFDLSFKVRKDKLGDVLLALEGIDGLDQMKLTAVSIEDAAPAKTPGVAKKARTPQSIASRRKPSHDFLFEQLNAKPGLSYTRKALTRLLNESGYGVSAFDHGMTKLLADGLVVRSTAPDSDAPDYYVNLERKA